MEKNCLQAIMEQKHITYRQLSHKTGIALSTIHRIANFQQSPTQDTMVAIAKGLQMQVVDIFNLSY